MGRVWGVCEACVGRVSGMCGACVWPTCFIILNRVLLFKISIKNYLKNGLLTEEDKGPIVLLTLD